MICYARLHLWEGAFGSKSKILIKFEFMILKIKGLW